MKKFLVSILVLFVFAVTLPLTGYGQSYCRKNFRGDRSNYRYSNYGYNNRRYNNRRYNNRRSYRSPNYRTAGYYDNGGGYYRRPSFYRRHRNLVNMGIGTGAGALLGGLVGGRRGIGWGALAGAGASALYTYKIRPKQRRY